MCPVVAAVGTDGKNTRDVSEGNCVLDKKKKKMNLGKVNIDVLIIASRQRAGAMMDAVQKRP